MIAREHGLKAIIINEISGPTKRPELLSTLYGNRIKWLVDTGAALTVLEQQLVPPDVLRQLPSLPLSPVFTVMDASGRHIRVHRLVRLNFTIGHKVYNWPVLLVTGLATKAILGMDFLKKQRAVIIAERGEVRLGGLHQVHPITLSKAVTLPARSAVAMLANINISYSTAEDEDEEGRTHVLCNGKDIEEGIALLSADSKVRIHLNNSEDSELFLPRGTVIGQGTVVTTADITPVTANVRMIPPITPEKWQYLCQNIKCGFQEPWKTQFMRLVKEFHDVFSSDKYDLGYTDEVVHKVRLKTNQPVHKKQYRIPWAHLKLVHDHVTNLQKQGVIEASRSAYNSPVFCVPKHSGELRVVQDFRALNDASLEDKYSIREISECIDEIGKRKSTIFSTLDLTSGFWQQSLETGSRECTAFTVPGRGRFQWTRTPMGLHGSPASFARLMDHVMEGLPGVLTYIDDVLVHAPDMPTHLTDLRHAFQRLRRFNLKLNVAKCDFAVPRVPYLGFTLTKDGILPGEDKLKAVERFPTPSTPRQIREFTGLVNYFRHMIPGYAYASGHLTKLLSKESGWKGGQLPEDALTAFHTLKKKLCEAPVLSYPRNDRPFILATDAATGDAHSPGGLGAVLSQKDDQGRERVVAYASRSLKPSEKNYNAFLLESQAATWAVDHFHTYLYGNKFDLITDHRPMEKMSLIHHKTLNRLKQLQSEYNFTVTYRPGTENQAADALSRNPVDVLNHTGLDTDTLIQLQQEEEFIQQLQAYRNHGHLPTNFEDRKYLLRLEPSLCQEYDGLWYKSELRKTGDWTKILVLPTSFRAEILNEAHCSRFGGHGGHNRTRERIKTNYWWPRMGYDVNRFVDECLTCQKSKDPPGFLKRHAPQQPLPIPERPNQRIHVDLFGALKTSEKGKNYILVMTDAFTKWVELAALINKDAETVAMAIFNQWICRFGCPKQIVSDRGTDFNSALSAQLYQELGIKRSQTAAFHPECNSAAESFNREIIRYLKTMLQEQSTLDWEAYLPTLQMSYNSSIHSTTLTSPFYSTFLRDPSLPYFQLQQEKPLYTDNWATDATLRLKRTYAEVVKNSLQAQDARLRKIDQTHQPHFDINEEILLYFPRSHFSGNSKFSQAWVDGYYIEKQLGPFTYLLNSREPGKRRTTAHANRIKSKRMNPTADAADAEGTAEESTEDNTPLIQSEAGKPRRGRGRPRKIPAATSFDEPPVKRRPGRPRKCSVPTDGPPLDTAIKDPTSPAMNTRSRAPATISALQRQRSQLPDYSISFSYYVQPRRPLRHGHLSPVDSGLSPPRPGRIPELLRLHPAEVHRPRDEGGLEGPAAGQVSGPARPAGGSRRLQEDVQGRPHSAQQSGRGASYHEASLQGRQKDQVGLHDYSREASATRSTAPTAAGKKRGAPHQPDGAPGGQLAQPQPTSQPQLEEPQPQPPSLEDPQPSTSQSMEHSAHLEHQQPGMAGGRFPYGPTSVPAADALDAPHSSLGTSTGPPSPPAQDVATSTNSTTASTNSSDTTPPDTVSDNVSSSSSDSFTGFHNAAAAGRSPDYRTHRRSTSSSGPPSSSVHLHLSSEEEDHYRTPNASPTPSVSPRQPPEASSASAQSAAREPSTEATTPAAPLTVPGGNDRPTTPGPRPGATSPERPAQSAAHGRSQAAAARTSQGATSKVSSGRPAPTPAQAAAAPSVPGPTAASGWSGRLGQIFTMQYVLGSSEAAVAGTAPTSSTSGAAATRGLGPLPTGTTPGGGTGKTGSHQLPATTTITPVHSNAPRPNAAPTNDTAGPSQPAASAAPPPKRGATVNPKLLAEAELLGMRTRSKGAAIALPDVTGLSARKKRRDPSVP
jgi:RNase H-like domain found in reverse transcriptase/Reverse transcriptase (RNA-dependent DNA polymerase)/Integrase zinc binding domain/Integrase core domain/gag-polyprotein putative aspartyl protease